MNSCMSIGFQDLLSYKNIIHVLPTKISTHNVIYVTSVIFLSFNMD